MKESHLFFGGLELPPPLSNEELKESLNTKDFSQEAQKKLVEHNLRLVVHIAKKFENTMLPIEDLVSVGTIGLIKAVKTYNVDKKAKLVTYASRCIQNEILMYLRSDNKWKTVSSLSDSISIDDKGNVLTLADICVDETAQSAFEIYENREIISNILNLVLNTLSSQEAFIFLCILGGKTQKEIEKKIHISQSYISRIQNRTGKKLLKMKNKKITKQNITFVVEDEYYCIKFSREYYDTTLSKNRLVLNLIKYEDNSNYVTIRFARSMESFVAIAELIATIRGL